MTTWWHNDIGAHPDFGGDFDAALRAITARAIILPAELDRYFPPVDAEYEARGMPNAECRPIPGVVGPHGAGRAGVAAVHRRGAARAAGFFPSPFIHRSHLFGITSSVTRVRRRQFTLWMADVLQAGVPPYRAVGRCARDTAGQQDWDEQFVEAIQTCRGLLFLMSADSVRLRSGCKNVGLGAQVQETRHPVALAPRCRCRSGWRSRQYLDCSDGITPGWRGYVSTSLGEQARQRDARAAVSSRRRRARAVPGAETAQRSADRAGDPAPASQSTERRVVQDSPAAHRCAAPHRHGSSASDTERPPRNPMAGVVRQSAAAHHAGVLPGSAPRDRADRDVPARRRSAAALRDRAGGVGKTAMVCRLLKALEPGGCSMARGELQVDGIVYLARSARTRSTSSNLSPISAGAPARRAAALLPRYRDRTAPDALMRAALEAFPDRPNGAAAG